LLSGGNFSSFVSQMTPDLPLQEIVCLASYHKQGESAVLTFIDVQFI
jgi:hypothetical protein